MTELADASSLEGALSVKPSTFLSSRSGGNKRCSKIEKVCSLMQELLLPQTLKPAGYICGAIGKWHLGSAPNLQPVQRGFDESFPTP